MKSFLSRKLVIGAVGLAVLAGAGGAVAATQNSTSPAAQEQAYLNDLASKLGVTPSALSAAIKAANSDQIDAALAAGRLTAAEASALKARIAVSTTAPFFGYGFGRHGSGGRGFGGRGFGGGIDAAAATSSGSARPRCARIYRPASRLTRSPPRWARTLPTSRPRSSPPRPAH